MKKYDYDSYVDCEYCSGEFFALTDEEADRKIAKAVDGSNRYQGFREGESTGWFPQFDKKTISRLNS